MRISIWMLFPLSKTTIVFINFCSLNGFGFGFIKMIEVTAKQCLELMTRLFIELTKLSGAQLIALSQYCIESLRSKMHRVNIEYIFLLSTTFVSVVPVWPSFSIKKQVVHFQMCQQKELAVPLLVGCANKILFAKSVFAKQTDFQLHLVWIVDKNNSYKSSQISRSWWSFILSNDADICRVKANSTDIHDVNEKLDSCRLKITYWQNNR